MNNLNWPARTTANVILIAVSIAMLFPLWVMIIGSLKTSMELAANPGGIPQFPTIDNYIRLYIFNDGILFRTFFNSIYIASVHTFLTIMVSALAAFAFAKYQFKGRDIMFAFLIMTIMVPAELTMPPLYILFSKIGWLNTFSVQIIPGIASVLAMFLMRQYMFSIPNELVEAAKMDGAGHLRTFWSIIMPASAPIIGALSIILFLQKWNDYLWPLVMVSIQEKLPVMVILPYISDSDGSVRVPPWELILAGSTLVTIPILIVFIMFQDKFMSSVTIGAVKE